jgi:hypothetical protein
MRQPKHIRIWEWYKYSPVKLTLRPNHPVAFGYREPTEEGYHSEWVKIVWDGERIYYSHEIKAVDCDGPISRHSTGFCLTRNKKARQGRRMNNKGEFQFMTYGKDNRLVHFPQWEDVTVSVRDAYADAMNY